MREKEIYNMGWGININVEGLYYEILKDFHRQVNRKVIKKLGGLEIKLPNQPQPEYVNFKPSNYISLPRSRCEGHC